ncbi:MAG: MoaD/ThiS family protein [Actinobacteria bacterium]|nr:MoaD/ThiS family protein [Actinomycetota bacterium]MCL5026062.1 MoaD/ThiS family protein [Chloroflexota bacterium]
MTLHLYSHLRAMTGQRHMPLDMPEGATVGDALAALVERYPDTRPVVYYRGGGLGVRLVLNDQDAAPDQPLHDGDELALLPPVGGGLW